MRVLHRVPVHDSQSGMWVFRREVLNKISPRSDTMALSEELKVLAFTHPELRCMELPIYYGERIGQSKLNIWRDGFGNLFFLVRMRLTLRRRRRETRLLVLPTVADEAPARANQAP